MIAIPEISNWISTMFLYLLLIFNFSFISSEQNLDSMYCDIKDKSCGSVQGFRSKKFIFYDVNPTEGFNLRRDVYMRFAMLAVNARDTGKNLQLVLSPWYNLYHWQYRSKPFPWSTFFDVDALKNFAPVLELHEVFSQSKDSVLKIDTLYVLKNFDGPFEDGEYIDKWEIKPTRCDHVSNFWGYKNITAKETLCVSFQGSISQIYELLSLHPEDTKIMFAHGEIPSHDNYGSRTFWDCRKSMKFNKKLVDVATNFMKNTLSCSEEKCSNYLSLHWRRGDFAHNRKDYIIVPIVPSIEGTAKQIHKIMKIKLTNIDQIFIATDAETLELQALKTKLKSFGYKVYTFVESDYLDEGSIAIVDQIICSHAKYFIGTPESTFSVTILEERKILGFDSSTTFNRLGPDPDKAK